MNVLGSGVAENASSKIVAQLGDRRLRSRNNVLKKRERERDGKNHLWYTSHSLRNYLISFSNNIVVYA